MSDHLAPPTADEARNALEHLSIYSTHINFVVGLRIIHDFIDHHSGCKQRADWLVEIIEEVTKEGAGD